MLTCNAFAFGPWALACRSFLRLRTCRHCYVWEAGTWSWCSWRPRPHSKSGALTCLRMWCLCWIICLRCARCFPQQLLGPHGPERQRSRKLARWRCMQWFLWSQALILSSPRPHGFNHGSLCLLLHLTSTHWWHGCKSRLGRQGKILRPSRKCRTQVVGFQLPKSRWKSSQSQKSQKSQPSQSSQSRSTWTWTSAVICKKVMAAMMMMQSKHQPQQYQCQRWESSQWTWTRASIPTPRPLPISRQTKTEVKKGRGRGRGWGSKGRSSRDNWIRGTWWRWRWRNRSEQDSIHDGRRHSQLLQHGCWWLTGFPSFCTGQDFGSSGAGFHRARDEVIGAPGGSSDVESLQRRFLPGRPRACQLHGRKQPQPCPDPTSGAAGYEVTLCWAHHTKPSGCVLSLKIKWSLLACCSCYCLLVVVDLSSVFFLKWRILFDEGTQHMTAKAFAWHMRKHFAKADRKITFDITITDGYSSVSGTGALCLSSNFQALFRSPREAHAKHPHLRLKPHLSFFHLLRLRHGILLWLRKSPRESSSRIRQSQKCSEKPCEAIFWHGIWRIFWHSIWHSIWHIFWHSIRRQVR